MATMMKSLNITARCGGAYRDAVFSPYGIGDAQIPHFLRICSHPGITQEQLSRDLCIHKSNVTRQVALLRERGFVERRVEQGDRRVRRLYPTARAQKLLPIVREGLYAWSAYLTLDFSEQEKELLMPLLRKLSARAVAYFESGELKQTLETQEDGK